MRRIRSGWNVAAVAGALMLLGPVSASAVGLDPGPPPRMDTDNFMLGESPYLISDATAVMPGVNAPNVATQPLWLPDMYGNRFIKLTDQTDYTANPLFDLMDIPGNISPATPLEGTWEFDITWDGTIGGDLWQDALPSFCMSPGNGEFGAASETPSNGSGCDLMKNDEGEIKLFYVVWDVRWVDESDPEANANFVISPSLLDGFLKDGVTSTDPTVSSPMHADNSINPFVPVLNADGGMGIKYAANPGETVEFSADFLLGENPFDTYDGTEFDDHDKMRVGYSLFVYRVPEPGTGLLLVSGLIGLAAFGRRRSA